MDVLERFKQDPFDPDAQEALFIKYRRFLYHLARRFESWDGAIDADDLVQEGFFALMDAALRHDPSSKKPFTSWCAWFVNRAYARALHAQYITGEDGRRKMLLRPMPLSLDEPLGEEGETVRGDLIEDPTAADPIDRVILQEIWPVLQEAVDELPPENAQIVRRHYLDGKSLSQTAAEMGMKYPKAYDAHGEALRRLRKMPAVRRLGADLNYYRGKSIASFHRTHTSITEDLAFLRMEGGVGKENENEHRGRLEE